LLRFREKEKKERKILAKVGPDFICGVPSPYFKLFSIRKLNITYLY